MREDRSKRETTLTNEVEQVTFPVVVVDIRDQLAANPAHTITRKDLLTWEEQHGQIPSAEMFYGVSSIRYLAALRI